MYVAWGSRAESAVLLGNRRGDPCRYEVVGERFSSRDDPDGDRLRCRALSMEVDFVVAESSGTADEEAITCMANVPAARGLRLHVTLADGNSFRHAVEHHDLVAVGI